MKHRTGYILGAAAVALIGAGVFTAYDLRAQGGPGRSLQPGPVDLTLRESFEPRATDAQTAAIVAAAEAFAATLDEARKQTLFHDFGDNLQRATWSNFPDGPVQRGGLRMADLTPDQRAALDALLATVMSGEGMRNIALQLAAEDTLGGGGRGARFGSQFYYVSILGEPSPTLPWMLQFGGHHLAINVTFYGADISFAPMLTGGEPLNIDWQGERVLITRHEVEAAQALFDSLDAGQKAQALRGNRALNLLLGPGEDGTVIAPEGIAGRDLTRAQHALLLDLVSARLGFINADDFAAKMARVEADLDDTRFGWWGPQDRPGAAYFRVTGPSLVLEYSPQGRDPADHAHNMYRDPANDYGKAWIALQ